MINKIIKGHSFKGIAAYVGHDPDQATTSERVEVLGFQNLETDKIDTAWKLMTATHYDADRLKSQAGIRRTGRKPGAPVLHVVLSWHTEEQGKVTSDEMLGAAQAAIGRLKAKRHQAFIVAHDDTENPHCHIVINRVNPSTGKMLSSSNDHLKLSNWAQKYREDRAKAFEAAGDLDQAAREHSYCKERQLNNEARKRGEFVKHMGKPRNVVEAEKLARAAVNDNNKRFEPVVKSFALKTKALGQRSRESYNRHRKEWIDLEADHKAAIVDLQKIFAKRQIENKRLIQKIYRSRLKQNQRVEAVELADFIAKEKNHMGRVRNSLRLIDTTRSALDGERLKVLSQTFAGLLSSSKRAELFQGAQQRRKDAFLSAQRTEIKSSAQTIKAEEKAALKDLRGKYLVSRVDLRLKQNGENSELKSSWRTLSEQRKQAFKDFAKKQNIQKHFNTSSGRERYKELDEKLELRELQNKAGKGKHRDKDRDQSQ